MALGIRPTIYAGLLLLGSTATAAAQGSIVNNPYGALSVAPIYPSPYWGYTGDPYAGYLYGAGSVIQAQSQFMISKQQAQLMIQQVDQEKLKTRRARLEQWLWERQTLPTPEDERQRRMVQELQRSRNDPPVTEIWSGKALNDLLQDAFKIQNTAGASGQIPLPEKVLARINVTTGKAGASIGVLQDGKLQWPYLFKKPLFDSERQQIDRLVEEAATQARNGRIDAGTLDAISSKLHQVEGRLPQLAKEPLVTPHSFAMARNFIKECDALMVVLQSPDGPRYFNGQYSAKGRNVAELVDYMKNNGLFFAAASGGAEAEYNAVYRALRDYDSQAGSTTPAAK